MSEEREVSRDQIEKANDDIVGVIGRHIQLKKTGKNWSACCPFHKERSPSFTVSPEKGMYYCFGCGAGGDAVKFVREHLGIGFRDAVESINGRIDLESSSITPAAPKPRAVRCDLPGHAENPERAASFVARCSHVPQHPYLARNNTAPSGDALQLKGALIVPLLNNLGEQVNAAAITVTGITYAAGKPSFGSTAILEPGSEHDGVTIICQDYAHAWRLWWSRGGRSRVLCTMDAGNLSWMLANCRERFTHVGCDPLEAEWFHEQGHEIIGLPIDPYAYRPMAALAQSDAIA
ncbi:CHC2 zinc finger domain-containing protein [Pseudomonas sp.]|uniref:CHC2 zinc finger domain-containing protein n=1 Tax=Pseudomonas sp. TaxID=306 RepID=UPI00258B5A11|nr:CHC2 zinc finger domain-containing protein [Pseudomonas sp.]